MRLKLCQRCGLLIEQDSVCSCRTVPVQRESASERGYDAWWTDYSRLYRQMNPLCVACEAAGFVTPACMVDHIVPFHVGGTIDEQLRRDPNNHQSLCDHRYRDCHNRLKKPLEMKYQGSQIRQHWFDLLERLKKERIHG